MGKKQTFQNYKIISCEAKIHIIPKPWDEQIPILWNKFPGSALPHRFRVSWNHASPNIWECPNFLHESILWKVMSLSSCEFLRKLKVFRKPKQSPEFES